MNLKAINGNILVAPKKNVAGKVFTEADARKDIQFGVVESVSEGSQLKVGDTVCYNPRSLTNITVDGELKGALSEGDIRFIANDA
jgi:co-chaperonin GroES (HSP10)